MAHFVHPDGAVGDGAPLLGDQAAVGGGAARRLRGHRRAALAAPRRAASRAGRASTSARRTAAWSTASPCPGESAGLLAQPVPALDENAAMAEVLLRLEAYTGEARLREQALEILAGWAPFYEQYGVAAAAYGQALLRYLERPDQIVVVGRRDDDEARRLHAAALSRAARRCAPSSGSTPRTRSTPSGCARPASRTSRPRPPTSAAAAPARSSGLEWRPALLWNRQQRRSAIHVHGGTMITLYQSEWCFFSHRVRQVLTELGLTYTTVNVPAAREDRVELMAIAGQDTAPVLTDGDKVYGDSDEIIEYLRATYPGA